MDRIDARQDFALYAPKTGEMPRGLPSWTMTVHVAMWSGPRNISTAMMRSFGTRADTTVVDEPLDAHYVAVTGIKWLGSVTNATSAIRSRCRSSGGGAAARRRPSSGGRRCVGRTAGASQSSFA
ncbi:hypothetical protein [Dactylosporangium fulvum]|uniref:Uncharacterized protein n=1 Tax=Dactylosporangium fulvum TaxID=53359 RepID=A0ABY5VW19_9ACTN|nr:hypothetical protein [Dactylosporangium fulvum]UWP81432.1 hypothetical protein Dfulv_40985 [Dactylosporangium fulvum]